MTDVDQMLETCRQVAAKPVDGWDFSELSGGLHAEPIPWSFDQLCAEALRDAGSALDEGTGGGERLVSLRDSWPERVAATEGWDHNLPIARAALEPLGVHVVRYDAAAGQEGRPNPEAIPFEDQSFDVVMNCHEAADPDEDVRVLRPGGRYLTQQVGRDDFPEAHILFGTPVPASSGAEQMAQRMRQAGLVIDRFDQWHGPSQFTDVATYVRYETLVPWDVPPDFSVDRYRDVLIRLHRDGPAQGKPLKFTNSRFLILAHRPG